MNNNIILCIGAGIACFCAGWFTNQKVNTETVGKDYLIELIEAQDSALILSNKVMWNNNLYDTDGSDDMADYLEACCKVDSLWLETL